MQKIAIPKRLSFERFRSVITSGIKIKDSRSAVITSKRFLQFLSCMLRFVGEVENIVLNVCKSESNSLLSNNNPMSTVIVFFVDFCVCPTIDPYPANAS